LDRSSPSDRASPPAARSSDGERGVVVVDGLADHHPDVLANRACQKTQAHTVITRSYAVWGGPDARNAGFLRRSHDRTRWMPTSTGGEVENEGRASESQPRFARRLTLHEKYLQVRESRSHPGELERLELKIVVGRAMLDRWIQLRRRGSLSSYWEPRWLSVLPARLVWRVGCTRTLWLKAVLARPASGASLPLVPARVRGRV
jgi:hypothetical protein